MINIGYHPFKIGVVINLEGLSNEQFRYLFFSLYTFFNDFVDNKVKIYISFLS